MTRTHGMSKTHPLYGRWTGMRGRCNDPNHKSYHRYGGRGIKVCPRWDDFEAFVEDMAATFEHGCELHRLDEDGDYAPSNCVWLHVSEHRSQPKSAEHRAKIGAAHRGRKKSPEQVEKQAAATRIPIDEGWLRRRYIDLALPLHLIALEAGCSRTTIHRAVRRHGLER